jgi:hypothetical protein
VAHRIAYLDSALAYICSHDRVWFATGEEIVRYWLQIGRNLLTGRAPYFVIDQWAVIGALRFPGDLVLAGCLDRRLTFSSRRSMQPTWENGKPLRSL